MHEIDIYFSTAVNNALDTLHFFHGIEPTIDKLMDHPSLDNLLIGELETPYLYGLKPGKTIRVRVWIRFNHRNLWSEALLDAIKYRFERQALGESVNFVIDPIIYTT